MAYEIYVHGNTGSDQCVYINNVDGGGKTCIPNWGDVSTISGAKFSNISGKTADFSEWYSISNPWTSQPLTGAITFNYSLQSTNYEVVLSLHVVDSSGAPQAWKFAIVKDHSGNLYLAKIYDTSGSRAVSPPAYMIQLWDPQIHSISNPDEDYIYETLYYSFMPNGQLRLDDLALYGDPGETPHWIWNSALINFSYPVTKYASGGYTTPPTAQPSFDWPVTQQYQGDIVHEDLDASKLFGDSANPTYDGAWIMRSAAFNPTITVADIAADQMWIPSILADDQEPFPVPTFNPMWAPCNTGIFQVNAASDSPPTKTTAYAPFGTASYNAPNTPCNPRATVSGDVAYQMFQPGYYTGNGKQVSFQNPNGARAKLSLSTSALQFTVGTGGTGQSTPPQSVTVRNLGSAPLTISGINIGGSIPKDFSETNNCTGSLAVGASCTVNVVFTNITPDGGTATLTIKSSDTLEPNTVQLTGVIN
jgi:hypothetical protein